MNHYPRLRLRTIARFINGLILRDVHGQMVIEEVLPDLGGPDLGDTMSPYRIVHKKTCAPTCWVVVAQQSPFLAQFELATFRWRWVAIVRAWLYTTSHEYSECLVMPADEDRLLQLRSELRAVRNRFYW